MQVNHTEQLEHTKKKHGGKIFLFYFFINPVNK